MKRVLPPAALFSALAVAGILGLSPTEPIRAGDAQLASGDLAATNSTVTLTNPPAASTNSLAGATNAPVIPPAKPPVALSPGVSEVVRMAQSGVSEEVIEAYVENSPTAFSLNPDEIIYLRDLGISDKVITGMIDHGKLLRDLVDKAGGTPPNNAPAPASDQAPTEPSVAGLISTNAAGGPVQTPAAPQYSSPVYSVPTVESAPQPPVGQEAAPVVVQAPPQVTYQTFYNSLSPYGSWVYVPDYGYCWQPTVVAVDPIWQPYCDRGRWLYTDCGWYWQSDYSWGWAPFHYGRWSPHPVYRWLWVPDHVWGPSWVVWRRSDLYCGWAPLPPGAYYREGLGLTFHNRGVSVSFGFGISHSHFTFVPISRFCDPYPRRHFIHGREVVNIYNRTKVVNNYYVQGSNHTIVNGGINKTEIAQFSRSEIRKVSVREVPAGTDANVKPDRLAREGSDLVVYRPQTRTPAAAQTRASQERIASSAVPASSQALRGGAAANSPSTEFKPVGNGRAANSGITANRIAETAASPRPRPEPVAPGALMNSSSSRVPGASIVSTRGELRKSDTAAAPSATTQISTPERAVIHTPTEIRRGTPAATVGSIPTRQSASQSASPAVSSPAARPAFSTDTTLNPRLKAFESRSGQVNSIPQRTELPPQRFNEASVAPGGTVLQNRSFPQPSARISDVPSPGMRNQANPLAPRLELSRPAISLAPPQNAVVTPSARSYEMRTPTQTFPSAPSQPIQQFRPENPRTLPDARPTFSMPPPTRSYAPTPTSPGRFAAPPSYVPSPSYSPRTVAPSSPVRSEVPSRSYSAPASSSSSRGSSGQSSTVRSNSRRDQ